MHPLYASQLSARMSDRIEQVCHELLPKGVRKYNRWVCGSVNGEAGESLKVEMMGEKRGIWSDFATGEGGDLLDLWCAVRRVTVSVAMTEAATFLGIRLDGESSVPQRTYRVPAKPACRRIPPDHPMMTWLKARGFTEDTITRYRLAVNEQGELVMPYIKGGKFMNAKYRTLPKTFRQEVGTQPTLFGWQVLEECHPNSRWVMVCEGECFPGDAELLTPAGWIRLEDYRGGDVAQWQDGQLTFVDPLALIRKPFEGELIESASPQFHTVTTPGHKQVSIDAQGRPYFHTAQEGPQSPHHHIPCSGRMDGPGIPLTDAQIDVYLTRQQFPWEWIWMATIGQRWFILNRLKVLQGHPVSTPTLIEYRSTKASHCHWVQAMAHTVCCHATPMNLDEGFGVLIDTMTSTIPWSTLGTQRIPYAGYVYCVQVPSGAILVRQDGKISVSGNCDAMALHQYGFPALSVPMGGGGGRKQDWIDTDFDDLMRFDTIYLATDMDEAGDRAADEIARRLGAERCRRVTLPFKDANECLLRGVTLEAMNMALRTAKSNDPVELKRAGVFTEEVLELFAGGGALGASGVKTPWGREEYRLRPGELTIVSGYSGSGKSTLISQMAVDGMVQGSRWCIASMEMPARATLGGMVQTISQTPTPDTGIIQQIMRWLDERVWIFDVRGSAQTDRMLTVFDYAARRYAISDFVIDSLAKCGMDEDDYNGQKHFVERLTDLNHAHNCHTMLVAHSRKQESEAVRPRKHDVRGATAITDMADNVLIVWRDKREESSDKAELIIDKQRLTGWEGTIHLNYNSLCKQFLYGEDGPKDYFRSIQQRD